MCRSFFLPVLYEISFNLVKQKATKVKNSTKKQTYRNSRIARSSFKNFEIEIKQQKKKKKKIAASVSPVSISCFRYIFTSKLRVFIKTSTL